MVDLVKVLFNNVRLSLIFGPYIDVVNGDVFFEKTKASVDFILGDLQGIRCGWVDEVVSDDNKNKKKCWNQKLVKLVTGGGKVPFKGKFKNKDNQAASNFSMDWVFTANANIFGKENMTKAMIKRLICLFQLVEFVDELDLNNPYSKQINRNLWNELESNPDHIVTAMINYLHIYYNEVKSKKLSLKQIMPKVFKDKMNKIINNSIYGYTSKESMMLFLKNSTKIEKDNYVPILDFQRAYVNWIQRKENISIKITQKDIINSIRNGQFQENDTQVYITSVSENNNKSRITVVKNISLLV